MARAIKAAEPPKVGDVVVIKAPAPFVVHMTKHLVDAIGVVESLGRCYTSFTSPNDVPTAYVRFQEEEEGIPTTYFWPHTSLEVIGTL